MYLGVVDEPLVGVGYEVGAVAIVAAGITFRQSGISRFCHVRIGRACLGAAH